MVVLDIGFKSEGSVPLEEFKDFPDLKIGDEVEVLLEHLEDQEGSVVLSKKKADFMRVWERIRVAYENDQPVEGTLVKKIKGGVVVDLMGVDAFLPGSQIALRRVPNIDELLGQKFEFKIIKLNKRRRNIVVSRRVILENERCRQAREADEGAREGSDPQGRRQEHHRLRRVHRPRRRRRPAPHHRHVVGPHLAPVRAGADRRGARSQGARYRLGARAHLARPQAAPELSVEGRRREVPGRHARRRARSSASRTTAPSSSSSRASKAWCTSPR